MTRPHQDGFKGYKVSECKTCLDFLTEQNYFGKALGKHFHAVMEIMYHGSLKVGPFRKNWFSTFPELYSFIDESSYFNVDKSQRLILQSEHYQTNGSNTPFLYNLKLQDNDPFDGINL